MGIPIIDVHLAWALLFCALRSPTGGAQGPQNVAHGASRWEQGHCTSILSPGRGNRSAPILNVSSQTAGRVLARDAFIAWPGNRVNPKSRRRFIFVTKTIWPE